VDTNLHGALSDLTVLEIGDQSGDYAALLIGGLGADVIKIEPPSGAPSRRIGPYASDEGDAEKSLFFWRYNLGKRSLVLDLESSSSVPKLERLAAKADIVLLAGEFATVNRQLETFRQLAEANPRLIVCTITPFGLTGPYRELKMTDLTQMAMGGIMAVCGYDPMPDGPWDTPPIAPAMWHSYHIAGEYASVAILAALNFRDLTGAGQFIDVSIHEAVNTCTEIAMPTYIYNGLLVKRQTARHAAIGITQFRLSVSKDDIYMLASLSPFEREEIAFKELADQSGVEHVLGTPEYAELEKEDRRAALTYRNDLIEQVVASMTADEVFHRAQPLGLAWSPIRRPEDNLSNEHFAARGTFTKIDHPEIGRELLYPQTVATDGHEPHMRYERRAPRLGEHTDEILSSLGFGDRRANKSERD
jgi:crotonobetainyl-CoA:carnitine CoA-transferase CaiB-like acyl-CoA transferase